MKVRLRQVVFSAAFVLLIALVVWMQSLKVRSRALQREIAVWQAAGYPVDPSDLLPLASPAVQDPVEALGALLWDVVELPEPTEESAAAYMWEHVDRLSDEPVTDERPALARVAGIFKAKLDALHVLLDPSNSWEWTESLYDDAPLISPPGHRAMRLLLLEAEARAAEGDLAGMAVSYEDLALLAGHLGRAPCTHGVMEQMNYDRQLLKSIEASGESRAVVFEMVARHLRQRDYRAAFLNGIKGDAVGVIVWERDMPEGARRGLALMDVAVGKDARYCLATMREALERYAKPYHEQADPNWQPSFRKHGMTSEFMLAILPRYNRQVADGEAYRRAALLAFELYRQKQTLGTYEAALAATAVPISPVTGEPFTVAIEGGEVVISSPSARGDLSIEWRWE